MLSGAPASYRWRFKEGGLKTTQLGVVATASKSTNRKRFLEESSSESSHFISSNQLTVEAPHVVTRKRRVPSQRTRGISELWFFSLCIFPQVRWISIKENCKIDASWCEKHGSNRRAMWGSVLGWTEGEGECLFHERHNHNQNYFRGGFDDYGGLQSRWQLIIQWSPLDL